MLHACPVLVQELDFFDGQLLREFVVRLFKFILRECSPDLTRHVGRSVPAVFVTIESYADLVVAIRQKIPLNGLRDEQRLQPHSFETVSVNVKTYTATHRALIACS
ncbi:unnamed protein product [Nippostrongylus brasiliensis]|uniref:Uncharacterized protein n=1 Tax=Nippostrongylus brasiliensis TaxID=27835 RepID=A0A0N4XZ16_NIPBR|nr:unnamed protein product [Nippostrongylus brasiliensis]